MSHIFIKYARLHQATLSNYTRTFSSGRALSNVISPSANKDESSNYNVGDIIHGYKVCKVGYIEELNIRPYLLRHESTGSEHLHIFKENDSNNVFAVSLRTTPKNSTGVAHILEHLALCGSKKYSVRDPFFKMTTRSLATFMNAMTGPDFTVYPFSTQNQKDFENLLSVYTDAVFFPRLRPVDFRQEGWRLEHEKPEEKETPIVIRGVVYNEMKGVFSSSASIYCRQLLNQLFPDTTYRYESGGDPETIPQLTHEELKKFHQLHYHPSNAKFYTYGDFPLEDHLKLINERVMSKFSHNPQAREKSSINEQPMWTAPRQVQITCPRDPMTATPDKQTTTSVSYMLPTTNTSYDDMFAVQILSSLLIEGPNAPFYKNLIESGIGSDFSPSTGLGAYTKQPYFSVGLQNIKEEDVPKVHELIEKTFKEAAASGFPLERIEAILHNIELDLKHISGNFGLKLAMTIESIWNHDGDVIDYLKVNELVAKFKNDLANDKQYWSKLIAKHFINNSHKLFLTMSPDAEFENKRQEREKNLLQDKITNLNEVDRQTVLYEGMELLKIQSSKEDPSVLPCLEPSKDISRDLRLRTELQFETHKGVHLQMCEQPTNELVYFRAAFDIGVKLHNTSLIDYLPLFCNVATRLGAGDYDRRQFDQRTRLVTGGLGVSLYINPSLHEFDCFRSEVMIGSHCLSRNVRNMFELWSNVFKQIHFQENKDYLHQLIKAAAAELSEGISHAGQVYAMKRSSKSMTELGSLDEKLSGLEHIARMKDIASQESVESVATNLQRIGQIVLDPFNMRCALNAESDTMRSVSDELKRFVDNIQQYDTETPEPTAESINYAPTKVEDMKFPFATNYAAKSLLAVPRTHKDYPKLVILAKLISSKFLLREVREKGGAYGAGARLSNSGLFSFFSYRDPNAQQTLKTFDETLNWVTKSDEYSDRDIEESKLGVFQDVDRPVEPGRRGLNYFTLGETDDMRQEFRQKLLEVSQKDVKKVAEKYLKQKKFATYVI